MGTTFILRVILSAGIFLGLFSSRQSNQQQYSSGHGHAQQVPVQKKPTPQEPLALPLLPSDNSGHHEHQNGDVHLLCFDRVKRRQCGFSLRCAFVKLLLVITHVAMFLMVSGYFNHHQPTQIERIQNDFIQQDAQSKEVAFF